jgi:cytochrome c oxidase subunit 2
LVGLRQRIANGRKARLLSIAFLAVLAAIAAGCAGAAAQHPGYEPGYGPGGPGPGFFPLEPASQQGRYISDFYPYIFWIAVAVFILVEGLLLWIVLRYRRRPTDSELPRQTHGHGMLEVVWTLIPALVVTGLFAFTVDALGKVETANTPGDNPQLTVDVTGFQWQWTFEYPEQGISLTGVGRAGPTMALPVGEKIRIRLHGLDTDVIHSFYVPQFLYKKDVIPGRVNEFDVIVEQVGTYAGQCAEFCGFGHSDMHFSVRAMTPADFDAWVAQQQAPPSPSAGPSGAPPSGAPPSGAPPSGAPPSGAPQSAPPSAAPPTAVSVTSVGIAQGFSPRDLTIPADAPWSVTLTNSDTEVPHNVSIRAANPDGSDWEAPVNADAGGSAVYQPPALAAGDYTFFCSLHTNMTGTLHVGQ